MNGGVKGIHLLFLIPFLAYIQSTAEYTRNNVFKNWSVSLGFDDRVRVASMDDIDFSTQTDPSEAFVLNRLRLRADFYDTSGNKLFVECLDAREWAIAAEEKGNTDLLDVHQAYLEINRLFNSGLGLKAGRQKIMYGRGRILSAPVWGNKVRSFDALTVYFNRSLFRGSLFTGSVVSYEDKAFNWSEWEHILFGTYNSLNVTDGISLDLYAVTHVHTDKKDLNKERYTLGGRLYGRTWLGFEYDIESAGQLGGNDSVDVRAYAFSSGVSRKLPLVFNPEIKVEVNLASGDSYGSDDKIETFVPPYQKLHEPYGIIDFLRWQNMRELAGMINVSLFKGLKARPEIHWYWLDSYGDFWYSTKGKPLGSSDNGSRYLGSEFSVAAFFTIADYVKGDLAYSYFMSGDVARTVGDQDGVHFTYFQVMYEF